MKKLLVLCILNCSLFSMQPPAPAPAKGKLPQKQYDQKLQDTLVQAVADNNIESVKRLLKFKPRVDVNGTNWPGDRPLDEAVMRGNIQMAELLLANGANPNQQIVSWLLAGKNPLMVAVAKGNPKMVELLIQYGADIDAEQVENLGGNQRRTRAIDYLQMNHPHAERIKNMLSKTKIR